MKEELYKNLKKSNLFFLSLHSKELFHSNFIAWIAERNEEAFRKFFKDFTGIQVPNNYSVKREYKNFDLCISALNDNDQEVSISCIIENKVKSMPYAEQLEKYSEKLESMGAMDAKKVLLSLSTESLPNVDGWVCRTYEDLANSLDKIDSLFEGYDQFILKDYIGFIKTLHQLQSEWEIPGKYKAAFTMDDETKKLRIDDLCQKIIYSKILNRILKELGEQNCVIGSSLNKLKAYKGEKKLFADCGLSRSIGLLEVKVKVNSGYVLGIQLQGAQYRYLAESLKGNIHEKCKSDKDISQFVFNEKVCDLKNQTNNSIEVDGKKYSYCKFGDSFMYRYRDVSEANTEDIIKDIVKDCKALIKKVTE